MDQDAIRRGVEMILAGLGVSHSQDRNFIDTPSRVARAYTEILSGLDDTNRQIEKILSVSFPSTYSQIVIAKNIVTCSLCPHHLLPVRYRISVGYLPDEGGDVVGISKLGRLVEVLAHRPVLQEQLVEDVTHKLMERLKGCLGAACVAVGEHHCMQMRGVRMQEACIVTSSVKGAFLRDPDAKAEFMRLIA